MAEEQATQLADTRPYLDTPLRVAIPVNVPERRLLPARDAIIYENSFSPMAIATSSRQGKLLSQASLAFHEDLLHLEEAFQYQVKSATGGNVGKTKQGSHGGDADAALKNTLRDFTVLAQSSKRAGKKDVEATAYASLGVVYDNEGEHLIANEFYLKYLAICEELNDAMGVAAACNCIGVNYMLLVNTNGETSMALAELLANAENTSVKQKTIDYVQKAVAFHSRHLEVGPDAGGKLVSHCNLGLCLTWLGDINQAAKHHQDALRLAIKMQTLYGQSIAVGNLGQLALGKRDFATARTCFDQHLQLIQALLDAEAEINAWKLLAELCNAQESYAEALQHLEQARTIAQREGSLNELRRIHCLIGVARGTMEFADYAESLPMPQSDVALKT